ncbi:innexin inx2-like [Homarus americanus]|uniref:Innexin n=1 Tax=Homarus americanus TaxID=6706 RepID=A0A8J5K0F7_HOMAM|nr:innexin inx2-like [Homarus americanus]KAG7164695.1 Innexin inx2-like 5 [Homarus americanus]
MFDVFGTIRQLLKIDQIRIDNVIFCLHYKATMVILVTFSLLVTNKQYFGDPIDCMVDAINSHTIDMFCWIQSTYTIPSLTGAVVGEEVAHPGVSNHDVVRLPVINGDDGAREQYATKHHKYYQWVTLFLFIQAGMFYFPRFLWKRMEGGRVKGLVTDLNLVAVAPELREQRMNFAVEYFGHYFNQHNIYAYQFFTCEVLNFINVIGQMYLTDRFLDIGFINYGPRVAQYSMDSSIGHDPMDEIFPKVAKCTFHKFGPSGTIMRHDALCVLPVNILNQKIYTFLWFWFVLLAIISAFGLLYRLATFASGFRHLLLRSRSRLASVDKVAAISRRCLIGDWFILNLIAKNMDAFAFRDFINDLTAKLVEKEHLS